MAKTSSVEDALRSLAKRIDEHPGQLGPHRIRLSVNGAGGGVWTLQARDGAVTLVRGDGDGAHTAEVIADADAIGPVLQGKADGRAAFLAGGIRVRGDVLALQRLSAALGTHVSRRAGSGG
jgi:hypothetical protein